MHNRILALALTGTISLMAFAGNANAVVAQPATYCVHDIDGLPGLPAEGTYVTPAAINNRNQIVGTISNAAIGSAQAFIWDPNLGMRTVGFLSGHDTANANDINDAGRVVGSSGNFETGAHASFIWDEHDGIQELDVSLGGNRHSASGINRFGEVVGSSSVGGDDSIEHAFFLDSHGDVFDLGTVSDVNPTTSATAVNDRGTVAGTDSGQTFSQAFLWDERHGLQPLGQPDDTSVVPNAINDEEEVVGVMLPPDRTRAFRWTTREGLRDLGSLGGGETDAAEAHDINRWGTIVGWSQAADGSGRAFVWNERSGMRDLGEMMDPTSSLAPFASLQTAKAINDRGWIVVEGRDLRDDAPGSRTYLLEPRIRSGRPRCR
jgi:probable HAF family extracellular repeat protein